MVACYYKHIRVKSENLRQGIVKLFNLRNLALKVSVFTIRVNFLHVQKEKVVVVVIFFQEIDFIFYIPLQSRGVHFNQPCETAIHGIDSNAQGLQSIECLKMWDIRHLRKAPEESIICFFFVFYDLKNLWY